MKYIGLHSTVIEPHLDTCYLGSGKALPERTPQSCVKTILGIFPSREEAAKHEVFKIEEADAVRSNQFYNLRLRTFDKHGSSLSDEHRGLIRKTQTGKSRREYGEKYTGAGRTPAQLAGSLRAAEKIRGTKCPAKGSPGTKNQGFTPWYYIQPSGRYVEVHDRTKQEMAQELGLTYRQLAHAFHYTNEHKEARTLPRKGWVFGNLPRPIEMGGD